MSAFLILAALFSVFALDPSASIQDLFVYPYSEQVYFP